MRRVIFSEQAPKAIGPYSQAIACSPGEMVFVSGQIPLVPATMETVSEDVTAQTQQVIENLKAVLAAADCTLHNVVKTTIFLQSMNDFAAVNAVYSQHFVENPPARSTIEVAKLPKNVRVEIEAIAIHR
jgi:2-iminobutanoate/2-iminopropanoate deaminase